jgi:nitrite reductase/ring-hydroxylating ferredoxin subunit
VLRLCRLEDIGVYDARGFDPTACGEDSMFVLRQGSSVRAFENVCPHQGARLEYRKDRFLSADGRFIVCFAHGARFDPASGECMEGACEGQFLTPLACEVRDDWVWIEEAPR